ncbi:Uncharacterised protein [Sphingobacterium multivorum]|uniref:Uncharacterized protein n=1 Tax=Sphingobacterium multivorum TaxID=28454 RepID=A0A2X2JJE1_SPHMU|nr:Uncharacterised protein [Sphingobacterium multivorum]
MIAKIGKGSNMYGAILYNQQKVDRENGAYGLRQSAVYCFQTYGY